MNRSLFFIALFSLIWASGCQLADLRTSSIKQEGLSQVKEEQGRALLEEAWKAQGMDKLRSHQVYETTVEDHWRGTAGKFTTLWPETRVDLRIKYGVNTFDSQLEYLSGEKKDMLAGQQSWNYYEKPVDSSISFDVETDKKASFGLAAFQYFFELIDRLKDAPIVSYAGEHEALGARYDLVFVTWESAEPNQQFDHYRLWINKETKRLEVAEYTIRDAPQKLPGAKAFYGSIWFQDFREIDGISISFQQYIFINAPKDNPEKYIHKLTVKDFAFDNFDPTILYPNSDLPKLGDDKVAVSE